MLSVRYELDLSICTSVFERFVSKMWALPSHFMSVQRGDALRRNKDGIACYAVLV